MNAMHPVSIESLEQQLTDAIRAQGANHRETQLLRDNLAIRYRNAGHQAKSDELYRESGVCEHLRPVEDYIRSQGARVMGIGSYWSINCRTWVVFQDVILDAEALKKKFSLPDFVSVHTHRGTHDGSEHGLVCERHHDALIGVHPDLAETARVIR